MNETNIIFPKKQIPILLTDGVFIFPKCTHSLPLLEGSERLKEFLIYSLKEHQGRFLIVSSKEKLVGEEKMNDLKNFYSVGTLGRIVLNLAKEGNIEIINSLKEVQLEGLKRVQIVDPVNINGIWQSEYQVLVEPEQNKDEKKLNELIERFVQHLPNILKKTNLALADRLPYLAMGNLGNFIDFLAQNNLEMPRATKQTILATLDLSQRLDYLLTAPEEKNKQGFKEIDRDINIRTTQEIKKKERIFFLREKKEEIERELNKLEGSEGSVMQKYSQRLEKENFPESVKKVAWEEIKRYKKLPALSSEANIIESYLANLMSLPWYQQSPETNDLTLAQNKLDQEHYGLESVKTRIIEYLALIQKTGKVSGMVLLLIGPPGTGKTTLAKIMAQATGRKFARISVGGIEDVAELKGHRRTYIQAMTGKIIQEMKKAQTVNPLFLIDEVDKIPHQNFRGNPANVLLEMFDPSQNQQFEDNYLGQEVPYDLSKVMFVCTANSVDTIPRPLLNRMEIIRISSYSEVSKLEIARRHLIPNALEDYHLTEKQIIFQKQALRSIIRHYTWEGGVRELNRLIQKILRKFILKLIQKKITKLMISPKNLVHYLGKPIYDFTKKEKILQPGLTNGLAWTENGGDILPIEVNYFPGKGRLNLTGNLGKVMKESAEIALAYVKANHSKFGIEWSILANNDIHIHAPRGGIPKDGPSAGTALTTAIISAARGQAIPNDIGMTGEITLLGNVLAIGGLKEKAIAAYRSGLKIIFIPQKNERDIKEIPKEIRKELKIFLISRYEEIGEKLFFSKLNPLPVI